jgi:hypothetical protein
MSDGWIFALVVGIIGPILGWVAGRRRERAVAAERRAEQGRANVSAALIPRSQGGPTLVVRNAGPSTARDLGVKVDGKTIDQHECFHRALAGEGILGAFGEREFRLINGDNLPDLFHVEVRWSDDSGAGRRWASDVTLGR